MNDSSRSFSHSDARAELSGALLKSVEEVLREPIAEEDVGRALDRARQLAQAATPVTAQRSRPMRRIGNFAAAATILVAIGVVASWITLGGGAANIAFARVADALNNLRSATYDVVLEINGKPPVNGKGLFLAPSRERRELPNGAIVIVDTQAAKAIALVPEPRLAVTMDLERARKSVDGPDLFTMVRQIVREGSRSGEKAESLGAKEIAGHKAVGFRARSKTGDVTVWADPHTALPIRVEYGMGAYPGQLVMNNFRYDVGLDPSLFNLQPPAGYPVQSIGFAAPVEEDLIRILRSAAAHRDGAFPKAITGMVGRDSLNAALDPDLNKLAAKYGKNCPEFAKAALQLTQKFLQGMLFVQSLTPENDSHYVGDGVKLGTPDRPIFWYKPTGAGKYRVILADLSVREAAVPPRIPNAQPVPARTSPKQFPLLQP